MHKNRRKVKLIRMIFVSIGILGMFLVIWKKQQGLAIQSDPALESGKNVLTQYGNAAGPQSMFYTIETAEGLIVIDGGWSDDADYVRQVIEEKGNHISAWILTHPHPDHIGAFNEIYENPDGITIDVIYAIDMDHDLYQQFAQPWDEFDVYERFCELTKDCEHLIYLYEGDSLTVCGLQMKVFHAYSDSVREFSADYANQGSMVFRLSGKKDSILFCGDIYGEYISHRLAETYSEELESTYLQMGHHGNNSITQELVEKVKPQAAFFDAPDWLVKGEEYSTKENMEMLKEAGAQIFSFESAPNAFLFE